MALTRNTRNKQRMLGVALILLSSLSLLSVLVRDNMGEAGFWVGNLLTDLFGLTAVVLVLALVVTGVWLAKGDGLGEHARGIAGMGLCFVGLLAGSGALPGGAGRTWGGGLGVWIALCTRDWVGLPGLILGILALAGGGASLLSRENLLRLPAAFGRRHLPRIGELARRVGRLGIVWFSRQRLTGRVLLVYSSAAQRGVTTTARVPSLGVERPAIPAFEEGNAVSIDVTPPATIEEIASAPLDEAEPDLATETVPPARVSGRKNPARWSLPPVELLSTDGESSDPGLVKTFIAERTRVIEHTLDAFRVEGKIVGVTSGARVILFEWQPAPGARASRLGQLADDLALALKAERVRVVVPLPGKGTIGIEIPHPAPADVTLGGLIPRRDADRATQDLPLYLGRSLTGESLVTDLVQMPHVLIAGTTGSGKSVCIHGVLISLLMKRSPDELRLLLIDPKRVEMIAYAALPHLQFEVISEPRRAVAALRWLVAVMESRYKLLARYGCRNLAVFNAEVARGEIEPDQSERADSVLSKKGLPWIVVAIDELADLMVSKPREVEDALQRIAQMARGVGIHLVVATQRPSVDVLTGVIKANLPSRISFQVATRVDSRTILDEGGADQLLGRGDMLFLPAGAPAAQRAQGAFVSPAEVERILKHWATQGTGEKAGLPPEVEDRAAGDENGTGTDEPLYEEAMALVLATGEASVSMLQRRLSIGFARAGRLVDIMERNGVVGPKQGSKAREILVDGEQSGHGGDT